MFLCRNAGDRPKRRAQWSQCRYSRKFPEAHPQANDTGLNLRAPLALARLAKFPVTRERPIWGHRQRPNKPLAETTWTADRTKHSRSGRAGGNKFHPRESWVRRPNQKADNSTAPRWIDGAGCDRWREGRALRRRKRICSRPWRSREA